MKTFTVEINGSLLFIEQDNDGAFLIPEGWRGIGSALKPAAEIICMARKPLSEKTIAANILRWGTGAINIDGCRIEKGRWPANVIHDGSDEVVRAFPDVHGAGAARAGSSNPQRTDYNASAYHIPQDTGEMHRFGDTGSAARFFFTAKASKRERQGSDHPTVKPLSLMRYLVRLVTPPNGKVLDPFGGTGTTGEAALLERCRPVLIEQQKKHVTDILKRMKRAKNEGWGLFWEQGKHNAADIRHGGNREFRVNPKTSKHKPTQTGTKLRTRREP